MFSGLLFNNLADYLGELGIKVHHLHSEIDTLERIDILRNLLEVSWYSAAGNAPPSR